MPPCLIYLSKLVRKKSANKAVCVSLLTNGVPVFFADREIN
jgi:hypothetical protein